MSQLLFSSKEDIPSFLTVYTFVEADVLKESEDFKIDNFADREILNPDMHNYLLNDREVAFLDEDNSLESTTSLALNAVQEQESSQIPEKAKLRLKKLKKIVKREFCRIVDALKDLKGKEIVKELFIALIPVFAVSGGVPAIVLPIIVAVVALYLKLGAEKACAV